MDLKFSLINNDGIKKIEGGAEASLRKNDVSIKTKEGRTLNFEYKDMNEIKDDDHELQINFFNGSSLILSKLGYKFKDFRDRLRSRRNKKMLDLLLMKESLKDRFEGEFSYIGEKKEKEGDRKEEEGSAEFRVYETGLVVVPEVSDLFRIPYGDIYELKEGDYTLKIKTGIGEELNLKKMGRSHKEFIKDLKEALSDLSDNVQSELKKFSKLSDIGSYELTEISELMRDGRAVSRKEINALSNEAWKGLINSLKDVGLEKEYSFLKSLSECDESFIGIKRGLMGDLTKEYVWLLIPILNTDKDKVGNAVVMESASNGSGKATYVFRAMKSNVYAKIEDINQLEEKANEFIKKANRAMMDINFRREPIYLSDNKLKEKKYRKYRFAVNRMSSLKFLRKNYLGRVFHRSEKQWKNKVKRILKKAT